jgi:hypothetical protein
MPTHTGKCVVCHHRTFCCSDEHVLGSGRKSCNFDPEDDLRIEFCSLECFMELRKSMEDRLLIAKELYPEWFPEVKNA